MVRVADRRVHRAHGRGLQPEAQAAQAGGRFPVAEAAAGEGARARIEQLYPRDFELYEYQRAESRRALSHDGVAWADGGPLDRRDEAGLGLGL